MSTTPPPASGILPEEAIIDGTLATEPEEVSQPTSSAPNSVPNSPGLKDEVARETSEETKDGKKEKPRKSVLPSRKRTRGAEQETPSQGDSPAPSLDFISDEEDGDSQNEKSKRGKLDSKKKVRRFRPRGKQTARKCTGGEELVDEGRSGSGMAGIKLKPKPKPRPKPTLPVSLVKT